MQTELSYFAADKHGVRCERFGYHAFVCTYFGVKSARFVALSMKPLVFLKVTYSDLKRNRHPAVKFF